MICQPAHPYDAGLHDRIAVPAAKRIFGASQCDDDIGEMVYAEFTEAVAAVAQHVEPNPYVPLANRIDAFLRHTLIPALTSKPHVKGLTVSGGRRCKQLDPSLKAPPGCKR